ncbi:uncharacterized protein ACNS7B_011947 [Menidia menidia]
MDTRSQRFGIWLPCWMQMWHLFIFLTMISNSCGQIRYSIPEEMKKGSLIGNIAQDLGLDVKRLRSGRARIVSGETTQYTELKADKGILVVNERIDREDLCGEVTPCSFTFEIILENPIELHRVTVEILDVNDHAPTFKNKVINLEISESATIGSQFDLESAYDPDAEMNGLQNYVLSPNDNFVLKQHSNADGIRFAVMILQKPLDRELNPHLSLKLIAVDGGSPQRSGTVNIDITVLDANDNPPVFNQSIYKAIVAENAPIGTYITTVNASDIDIGSHGLVTYSFSNVKGKSSDKFEINSLSGTITVIGNIDYEKDKKYEIRVIAKDQGGLSDYSKVVVEVVDINDNAPVINIMSFSNMISEDVSPGTTIAVFNVKDADSDRNGQITCSIDSNLPFKIQSSLTDYYNLLSDVAFDRETKPEYNITITATDSGTPPLSSRANLQLRISDVNDNAPVFNKTNYSACVVENNAPGLSIFAISAHDSDWNQNARISYFIEDREVSGSQVSMFVSINSESGVIHAVRSFDYEQIKQLIFTVRAQDGGSPPLSSNVSVKILIQDQNDNPPQVLYPVQTGGSVVAEMVPRSADVGYLVTKVVAVDVDSGQNAWLSYKLQKTTDRALFEVGLQNGEIRTIRQVTDKDAVKQRLTVTVEDNGQPSRSATVIVNVAVADSFPEVLSEFTDFTHDKEYNDNLTFYLVLALAVVSFLFITCLVVIISVKIYRWRQSRMLYHSNLPVIPYYPPRYSDTLRTGTLPHVYNYEVCRTTDSRKSDCKFGTAGSQNVLIMDPSSTGTMQRMQKINIMSKSNVISENAKEDTVVTMINIEDLDSGKNGNVECFISRNIPFLLKSSTNNFYSLVTDSELDRERSSEYNITVTCSDEGVPSLSSSVTLTLQISDVNDNAPVFERSSYEAYIVENNTPGLSIFTVKATDADWNQNARVSYILEDSSVNGVPVSSYVSVSADSGVIHAVRSFDYEQIKDFQFLVKAQDGGSPPLSSNVSVKILIQDQNDNPPQVLYPVQTGGSVVAEMVPRSADVGYLVTKVVAVDVDSGQNAWLSYKLQKATDRALFEVGLQNGEIRTIRQVTDKDAVKQRLAVTVEDNGQPSRSATVIVNVAVADSFPEVLSEFTDFTHDKEYNDNLTFYLVLALAVVSFLFITCLVVIISVKIYRWRQSRILYHSNLPVIPYYPPRYSDTLGTGTLPHVYNYEVCRTTDSRKSDCKFGTADSCKLIIDVQDENDNKPEINIMSKSNVISENAKLNTVVTMINIEDLDSGENGKVNCFVNENIPFILKSTTNNFYSLLTDSELDRERASEYNITVTCSDEGVPSLSSSVTLTLQISDVNDNAPVFEKSSYEAYILENNTPGLSIFTVKATDADWNQNARVSYILEDSSVNGVPVSSYVSVSADSGVIHAVRSFDYEQIKDFQFFVKAQDGGSPPLSSNVSVKILIQDQNDNPPQVLYPVQTGGSVVAEMVPRSADVGYLVTKVVAVDVDSGQNAWLSYKLQKATDRALFEVGLQNGEIRTSRQVTDKDAVKQRLAVTVEDNGQPSRSATVIVNVAVADSFPEVLSEFTDFTHDKEYNDNLTFYLVLALAVVSFLFITCLVVIISVKIYRWRQSRILYHSNLPVIPYYPPRYSDTLGTGTLPHVYNYEVCRTTDSRKSDCKFGTADSSKLIIDVQDVNDNVPGINIMSKSSIISEDSKLNTVVTMINIEDKDTGDNGKVNCFMSENIPFILKSTNNFYSLVTDSELDRERASEYNITVTCSDEGVPSLSSSVTLTLQISDVNDNAPVFERSSYEAYLVENNTPGLSIYTVKATDADWNQNARVSYILEDSSVNGVPVSSYVSVSADSGVIHAVRSFDYEQIKDFQFLVKAQDGGSPPLSSNVSVKILIQDQNDNPPQVLYPVQTGGSVVAEMVPRSADVGYLVTKVVAVDVDSGQNAWLSYKLQKATDRALFEVGLQNGEIRTIRQVTDKDAVKQRLAVTVEDNGQPSRSATVIVNVAVADSFPEVLSEFTDFTHDKEYNDNLTFYLVLALAVVSFLFITCLVVIISVKIYRWRQSRILYHSNLPVIPYYPPRYSDTLGTGTLPHVYNYEVCRTTDSRKSDCKFGTAGSQNVLIMDPSSTGTMQRMHSKKSILDEPDSPIEVRAF